jgi:hypothetical protein
MAATAAFPSLSELLAWPTEHLTEGADHWEATAGRWYGAFTQVWQDSLSIDWEGQAAEKLQTRTYADKVKVGELVDQLQEAAKTARIRASDWMRPAPGYGTRSRTLVPPVSTWVKTFHH